MLVMQCVWVNVGLCMQDINTTYPNCCAWNVIQVYLLGCFPSSAFFFSFVFLCVGYTMFFLTSVSIWGQVTVSGAKSLSGRFTTVIMILTIENFTWTRKKHSDFGRSTWRRRVVTKLPSMTSRLTLWGNETLHCNWPQGWGPVFAHLSFLVSTL